MTRQSSIASRRSQWLGLVLGAMCFWAQVVSAASLAVIVTTRDGQRETFTFSDFDEKRLLFELRLGKADRDIELRGVSMLEFPPADTTAASPSSDSLDVFTMVDGKMVRGTFRRMDDEKIYAVIEHTDREESFRISSLRQISFSQMILDVDRREFGTGFNLFDDDVEIGIASFCAQDVESNMAVLQDSSVQTYVTVLGQRLAATSKRPGIPYEFKVLNSGQVNAFTIGGGRVYIYRGLLEQVGSESELAGVLAHEIGHIVGKHTVQELSTSLLMDGIVAAAGELVSSSDEELGDALETLGGAVTYFTTLKYSRDDEREADFLAVYNLYAQAIHPIGMVNVLETLKRNEPRAPSKFEVYFETHPSLDERRENTIGEIRKLQTDHLAKDSQSFHQMQDHLLALPRPIVRKVLVADTVTVVAGGRNWWSYEVDTDLEQNCYLKAKFWAYGGTGNDIRVLLLDDMNYQNFINGHSSSPAYDSAVLTVGEASVSISTSGKYYLVLDNTFSTLADKAVVLEFWTEHTE